MHRLNQKRFGGVTTGFVLQQLLLHCNSKIPAMVPLCCCPLHSPGDPTGYGFEFWPDEIRLIYCSEESEQGGELGSFNDNKNGGSASIVPNFSVCRQRIDAG